MRALPLLRIATLLLPCVFASFAWTARAAAAPPPRVDRAQTSSPALAIGTSTQTVFLGGELLYYFQLPSPRWRVAIHVGAGGIPTDNAGGPSWGMAGGTFVAFGRHHRLVMGLEAGTLGWERFSLHGTVVARRQQPGAGLSVGWEWMSSFGLFSRVSVGPGFIVSPATLLEDREVAATFVGGWLLGYKPW